MNDSIRTVRNRRNESISNGTIPTLCLQWVSTGNARKSPRNKHNILFKKSEVPQNRYRDVVYGCIICDYWERKPKPNQTWLTVEGNKNNYLEDCGMPTADLLTMKLFFNSVISTHNAKFMIMDIKTSTLKPHSKDTNNSNSSWMTYQKIEHNKIHLQAKQQMMVGCM